MVKVAARILLPALAACLSAGAQSPQVFSADGEYLGNLNADPYDPNSVTNSYGPYGNSYSSDSISNPYGRYGSAYSPYSVLSPVGSGDPSPEAGFPSPGGRSPQIFGADGKYLGNLNANPYDPNSVANPYGRYGSPYSPDSIKNPYGRYGSPYSLYSIRGPLRYGSGARLGSLLGRLGVAGRYRIVPFEGLRIRSGLPTLLED